MHISKGVRDNKNIYSYLGGLMAGYLNDDLGSVPR